MIEVIEVKTKRQLKQFVDFPTKLYRGVKEYVHPLRGDEINNFIPKKNASLEDCEVKLFLAKKDGKIVGRIAGIIQHLFNEKTGEKRCRFSRFDSIDDGEVAKALFVACETWAKEQGMDIVHGPLGFNDLDREGMLIEGFDELSTFEEQYNFPYYQRLLEENGYIKETDWVEYKIFPTDVDPRAERLWKVVLDRYKLRIDESKNTRQLIKKYGDQVFDVINEAYAPLHGTVPITEKVKAQILKQFGLVISTKYFITIVDKENKLVAFGFAMPSLSKAVQKCEGRLFPFGWTKVLKAIKKPEILDLALVGIRPNWQGKGLTAVIMRFMANVIKDNKIKYCETNLNLEDNIKIQQQWEMFEHSQHKRRRCFIKHI